MTSVITDSEGRILQVGMRLFFPRTMLGQPAVLGEIVEITQDEQQPQVIVRYSDGELDTYYADRLDVEVYKVREFRKAKDCRGCNGQGYTTTTDDAQVECPYCDGTGGSQA